jgi:hypothetical protein
MSIFKLKKLKSDESGLVSFFVTIIIMIVLSLIVLGFSSISRREEQASLNRMLSTEAFYAAESGVNDAYAIVANVVSSGGNSTLGAIPSETQSCTVDDPDPNNPSPPPYISGNSNQLNPITNTKYSCLLVNPNPSALHFTPSPGQAIVTTILSADPSNPISKVDLNYSISGQDSACGYLNYAGTNKVFPPLAQWPTDCPPVLRIDLVRTNTAAGFSLSDLQSGTRSFFVYPSNGTAPSSTLNFGAAVNGTLYYSNCSSTCDFNITGLNADGKNYPYFIRILSIYGSKPTYNFTGFSSGGTQQEFSGAQLQIDSTGIAQTVLRRIQVNVSTSINSSEIPTPNYVIQTNSTVCKRLVVGSGFYYENIPKPAPAEAAIPAGSILNNSGAVGAGASVSDPCNPLW